MITCRHWQPEKFDFTLKFVARLFAGDDDSAGRRVATVDGALGPLQNFDLLQVGVLAVQRGRVGMQNAVNDEGETVLSVAGAVDAANVDLSVTDFRGVDDGHAGRQS